MKEKLTIINNEKCEKILDNIYCQNLEMKSLPESLAVYFDISLILRKSKISKLHQLNLKNIKLSSNIVNFIINIFKEFKNKKKYLIIAITPYTFLAYLLLLLRRKKIFLYLRSNGLEEWNLIFGKYSVWVYRLMLNLMCKKSKIICVNKKILQNKEFEIALPSQLDEPWFKDTFRPPTDEIKLLYVGRLNIVKGVFSLINLYEKISLDKASCLSLVGHGKKIKNTKKNIRFLEPISNFYDLIKIYDSHNITVLPSFTEGHPQVLIESLARMRPVIIFNEIEFVKHNYNGVFVSERKSDSFEQKIKYIYNNYNEILELMKKNVLPTKKEFINKMVKVLKE